MAQVLLGQDVVHVVCGRGTLQLLSVQHVLLQLIEGLAGDDVSLSNLAVTTTGAGGNQVSNTARLKESLILDILVEHLGELAHLMQTDTDDGSLGVVTELESINQSSTDSNNVLQGTAEFNANNVFHNVDSERGGMEDVPEEFTISSVPVTNCGLAELLLCDFACNVGSAKDGQANSEGILDHVCDESESILIDVNTLDQGDGLGVGADIALELLADACDELVRNNKDKHSGITAGLEQIRAGDNVLRQLDSWEIFDVLMLGVDDLGQVASVDLLLKDPHLDLVVILVEELDVASNDLGDSGTPVARSNESDLFRHGVNVCESVKEL